MIYFHPYLTVPSKFSASYWETVMTGSIDVRFEFVMFFLPLLQELVPQSTSEVCIKCVMWHMKHMFHSSACRMIEQIFTRKKNRTNYHIYGKKYIFISQIYRQPKINRYRIEINWRYNEWWNRKIQQEFSTSSCYKFLVFFN